MVIVDHRKLTCHINELSVLHTTKVFILRTWAHMLFMALREEN